MLPAFIERVKEGIRDNGIYYPLVIFLASIAILGLFRLSTATQRSGEGVGVRIEDNAFVVRFLEREEASFAALSSGTVYYPMGCKKLPKREDWAYLFFRTSAEAESVGLARAKGC